jgi:transposase
MSGNKEPLNARERISVIMKVQAGLLTATDAAAVLGISRKTYYEMENKALMGLMEALEPGKTGRPKKDKDPEKEAMARQIKELKQQVALNQMTINIRELFKGLDGVKEATTNKKKRHSQ